MEKRKILMIMILSLLVCNTFVTLNINVAIMSMIRTSEKIRNASDRTKPVICSNATFYWSRNNDVEKIEIIDERQENTYDWSYYERNSVLSAYHWLSWLSILPGSVLAQKYGSKIVVGYALCISAALSSVIPFVGHLGAPVVAFVRLLQGIFSFVAVPGGMVTIIGNWSSTQNRGAFMSLCPAGSSLGMSIGSYLFGYIGQYLHWKYIFHLTSVCGILWSVLWYFLIYDSPSQHPTITTKEKTEIFKTMKNISNDEKVPIPWKAISTSVPFIVCTLVYGAIAASFVVVITFMPSYLNDTYGLDSNQAGILISVPRFVTGIIAFVSGWFGDYMLRKHWLSVTNTRKFFASGIHMCAAISLIFVPFVRCNLASTIICYSLVSIFATSSFLGAEPTLVDMSPKFCGILQGIMATFGEFISMAVMIGFNHLIKILPTEDFWIAVFLATAVMIIVPSIFFLVWGSAETQPWNYGSANKLKKNENFPVKCFSRNTNRI